jgi:hypothetical protein
LDRISRLPAIDVLTEDLLGPHAPRHLEPWLALHLRLRLSELDPPEAPEGKG